MTLAFLAWLTVGAVAGVGHAIGLRRSAVRWRDAALAYAWRLPVTAGVLVAAAVAGGLLPAAGGWACGFAGSVAAIAAGGLR